MGITDSWSTVGVLPRRESGPRRIGQGRGTSLPAEPARAVCGGGGGG